MYTIMIKDRAKIGSNNGHKNPGFIISCVHTKTEYISLHLKVDYDGFLVL